jgi:asparagine synthase (glutamine-hydrolysing)
MAAIAGVMPRNRIEREALTEALVGLGTAMRRRAPIEGGMAVAYDGSIALAHRAGDGPGGEAVLQPLTNETGTLWLVADGEPANAADLRLELIGAGHRFRSACGSEVILHLYEQEGPGAFERLAGGFAFALWDRDQRLLVLGRDRYGERPLYVVEDGESVRFASEAQALAGDAALVPAAVTAFLALGYVPEPLTFGSTVRAIAPGSVLRLRGARARGERYWQRASLEPDDDHNVDRVRLGGVLRQTVEAAVAGEEEIGIALDGELASGALLAVVSPMLGRGLRTHTLVYDGPRASRLSVGPRPAASRLRAFAEWLRSEHHEHHVGPDALAAAFEVAAASDQPSIGAPLAHLTTAYVAASGGRVLLSAIGGQELLGPRADAWLAWVWRAGRRRSTRAVLRAMAQRAARRQPFGRAAGIADWLGGADALAAAYLSARAPLAPGGVARVVRPEVLAQAQGCFDALDYVGALACAPAGPGIAVMPAAPRVVARAAIGAIERSGPLVSGALRDFDGAAAGFGLALRAPYLDHRLLEWVSLAAAAGKRKHGVATLADVLRSSIPVPLRRHVGAATGPPLAHWIRHELKPLVESHLFADDAEGLFAADGVAVLWRDFLAGRAGARAVWALATLRAWIAARRDRERPPVTTRSLARRHAA